MTSSHIGGRIGHELSVSRSSGLRAAPDNPVQNDDLIA
jgi:hypothetical protein